MSDAEASRWEPLCADGVGALAPQPYGERELFFSITDGKGVIQHANATFVRVSGFTIEELLGAPHNIVREPAMPRGAFKLVWDELQLGRSVASYVCNRAADGSRYEVFAVMLPTRGGFISIRMTPHDAEARRLVLTAYDHARSAEELSRGAGSGTRETAAAGADTILGELAAADFPDLAALTRRLLPKEVAALLRATPRPVPAADSGPLGEVLRLTGEIAGIMRFLLGKLDELEVLTARLQRQREESGPNAEHLRQIRELIAEATDPLTKPGALNGTQSVPAEYLAEVADGLTGRIDTALARLDELPAQLEQLHLDVETTAQQISLFALQNEMIACFAAELLAGQAAQAPGEAMRLMHGALGGRSRTLASDADRLNEWTRTLPEGISQAVAGVDRVRRRLHNWGAAVTSAAAGADPDTAAEAITLAEQAVASARDDFSWLDGLANLAAKVSLVSLRIESDELDRALDLVGEITADIA